MLTELDKLKAAIKAKLKENNFDLSDEKLDKESLEIAKKEFGENKLDEEGRIIIAENAKIYIEAGITSIEE